VNNKHANQNKDSNQGKEEKACADYVKSYVRGFITVYIAWFLGVDVEDGFWATYFKPLERLWTENRAKKDVSLMRDKGLVMEGRLRFTKMGWRCMKKAIVRFLKGEFGEYQNINIIREYPVTTLVAPGFAYEHGIDLLDIANTIVRAVKESYAKLNLHPNDVWPSLVLHFIDSVLGVPEVEDYKDPSIIKVRVNIGNIVRAHIKGTQDYIEPVIKAKPSRWLMPVIPYLINLGYELHDLGVNDVEKRAVLVFCLRDPPYCDRVIRIVFMLQ
jgi:hypothetical protein